MACDVEDSDAPGTRLPPLLRSQCGRVRMQMLTHLIMQMLRRLTAQRADYPLYCACRCCTVLAGYARCAPRTTE